MILPTSARTRVLIPITAYLVVIVVACYFFPLKGTQAPGEIHLIHFTPNFVSTFPVQVFAYTCAQNVSAMIHADGFLKLTRFVALPYIQRDLVEYAEEDEHRHWVFNWISSYDLRDHRRVRVSDVWF